MTAAHHALTPRDPTLQILRASRSVAKETAQRGGANTTADAYDQTPQVPRSPRSIQDCGSSRWRQLNVVQRLMIRAATADQEHHQTLSWTARSTCDTASACSARRHDAVGTSPQQQGGSQDTLRGEATFSTPATAADPLRVASLARNPLRGSILPFPPPPRTASLQVADERHPTVAPSDVVMDAGASGTAAARGGHAAATSSDNASRRPLGSRGKDAQGHAVRPLSLSLPLKCLGATPRHVAQLLRKRSRRAGKIGLRTIDATLASRASPPSTVRCNERRVELAPLHRIVMQLSPLPTTASSEPGIQTHSRTHQCGAWVLTHGRE